MKRYILTESQLREYVEIKKSEKIFYEIVEKLHENVKYLNENISFKKANQSVLENYNKKKLITPKVYDLLIKHRIMDEKYEII
jgi:hypothetical protein